MGDEKEKAKLPMRVMMEMIMKVMAIERWKMRADTLLFGTQNRQQALSGGRKVAQEM